MTDHTEACLARQKSMGLAFCGCDCKMNPQDGAAYREARRKKRARQLLRMCGDAPEDLAMGWAEAEQRAGRAEIELTNAKEGFHSSCLAVDKRVNQLEAEKNILVEHGIVQMKENETLITEVAGMRDKWTPPDEVAELQIDLSKPPGERKYCAGCTLPELESEIRKITTPDPNFKGTLPSWEPIFTLLKGLDDVQMGN